MLQVKQPSDVDGVTTWVERGVGDVGGVTNTCAGGVGRYKLSCQSPVSNAELAMTAFSVTMGRPQTLSIACVGFSREMGCIMMSPSPPVPGG